MAEKRTLNIRALLVDDLSNQLAGIKKEIRRTGDATKKANDAAAKSWARLKTAAAAVAAVYIAIKGIKLARTFVSEIDAIGKLSIAAGESVDTFSELATAFEFAGGNAGQFKATIASILSSQNQAIKATGDQRRAFELLGISVQELRRAKPSDIFRKFAEGFTGVGDQTERLLAFAKLFPDQYRNVINLVGQGSVAFQKTLEDARLSGATVTKEQAKNAAAITDAFARVDIALASVGREIITTFGPALSNGLNAFAAALVVNKDVILNIAKLTLLGIRSVVVESTRAIAFLVEQFESAAKLFNSVKEGLTFGFADGLTDEQRKQRSALEDERKLLEDRYQLYFDAVRLLKSSNDLSEKQVKTLERRERGLIRIGRQLDANNQKQRDLVTGGPSNAPAIRELADNIDKVLNDLFSEDRGTEIREWFSENGKLAARDFAAAIKPEVPLMLQGFEEAAKESGEKSKSAFVRAWQQGIAVLSAEISDFGTTVGKGLATLTTSGVSAFSNELAGVIVRTKSAEEAFKAFTTTALNQVAKLIARLATLQLIRAVGSAAGYSFADGGVMNGVAGSAEGVPFQSYAQGGIARRPQLALFGEGKQAEAFVPLPDNRSIPVTFTGAAGPSGTGAVVNLNIYAWDSKDAARGLIDNKEVILGILQSGTESRNGLRQTIQRAAR
tara:strand:+ start:3852 stop:5867 length:2016 start_codon:yes stop_codon:yes gene_type:complete